jgi:hypothetical protein
MRFSSHPAGELRLKTSVPQQNKAATGRRPSVPPGMDKI